MNRIRLNKKLISLCISLFVAAGGITLFVLYKAKAESGDTKTKYDNAAPSASFSISKRKKVDVSVIYGSDNNYNDDNVANNATALLKNKLTDSNVDANVNINKLSSNQVNVNNLPHVDDVRQTDTGNYFISAGKLYKLDADSYMQYNLIPGVTISDVAAINGCEYAISSDGSVYNYGKDYVNQTTTTGINKVVDSKTSGFNVQQVYFACTDGTNHSLILKCSDGRIRYITKTGTYDLDDYVEISSATDELVAYRNKHNQVFILGETGFVNDLYFHSDHNGLNSSMLPAYEVSGGISQISLAPQNLLVISSNGSVYEVGNRDIRNAYYEEYLVYTDKDFKDITSITGELKNILVQKNYPDVDFICTKEDGTVVEEQDRYVGNQQSGYQCVFSNYDYSRENLVKCSSGATGALLYLSSNNKIYVLGGVNWEKKDKSVESINYEDNHEQFSLYNDGTVKLPSWYSSIPEAQNLKNIVKMFPGQEASDCSSTYFLNSSGELFRALEPSGGYSSTLTKLSGSYSNLVTILSCGGTPYFVYSNYINNNYGSNIYTAGTSSIKKALYFGSYSNGYVIVLLNDGTLEAVSTSNGSIYKLINNAKDIVVNYGSFQSLDVLTNDKKLLEYSYVTNPYKDITPDNINILGSNYSFVDNIYGRIAMLKDDDNNLYTCDNKMLSYYDIGDREWYHTDYGDFNDHMLNTISKYNNEYTLIRPEAAYQDRGFCYDNGSIFGKQLPEDVVVTKKDDINVTLKSLNWRQNTTKFVIDLSDDSLKSEITPQSLSDLEENNVYFIGATSSGIENTVSNLINKLDGRGTYIENTSLSTSLEKSESYIMSILNQQQDNSNIFLVGDEIDYKENYKDSDANDPKNDELWSYIQDNKHLNYDNDFVKCSQTGDLPLDNDLGMASFATGQWMHDKVTVFNKPGKYKVSLKVQDNPTATDNNPSGDSNFNDYDKWSTDDNSVIINVNRKPIASFMAYATANLSTGKFDITEDDGSDSYDPDHEYSDGTRKGIVNKDFQWKEVTDGVTDTWHEGKLPSPQAPNKDFLVKLQVEDLEGEYSEPLVKYVSTKNENLPPVAQFTESETQMPVDQLSGDSAPFGDYANDRSDVVFTDNSYDPNNDSIEKKWTVVDSNGNTVYTGSDMPTANTFYGKPLGTYTISLVCDDGPTPKVGVPLTSEPYTQQLTLVPINHMPVAHFEVDNTSKEPENIKITEDSTDPDGDPIVDRIWTIADGSGNIVEQSENKLPDFSTLDGTYTLTLKVEDNPKVPPQLWSKPYSQQITVESLKLVGTLYPNPAEQGQQVTFDLTTTGNAKYLRIYLPNDITSRDKRSTSFPLQRTIVEEDVHNEKITYILPLDTPLTLDSNGNRLRAPYSIIVTAQKASGVKKSITLYLDVQGNVLDNIKTTILDDDN